VQRYVVPENNVASIHQYQENQAVSSKIDAKLGGGVYGLVDVTETLNQKINNNELAVTAENG